MNLLAINTLKTDLMLVPPKPEEQKDVYLMTDDRKMIKSVKQVKILGIKFNSLNNMQSHVASLASSVGLAYHKLKPF